MGRGNRETGTHEVAVTTTHADAAVRDELLLLLDGGERAALKKFTGYIHGQLTRTVFLLICLLVNLGAYYGFFGTLLERQFGTDKQCQPSNTEFAQHVVFTAC
mgnify:CR=1 FL=1